MGISNVVMVDQVGSFWIVKVIGQEAVQDFRCFSEQMALQFAAIFQRASGVQLAA